MIVSDVGQAVYGRRLVQKSCLFSSTANEQFIYTVRKVRYFECSYKVEPSIGEHESRSERGHDDILVRLRLLVSELR
jgi:hypothetical protein